MKIYNIRIRNRFIISYGLIFALIVIMGIGSFYSIRLITGNTVSMLQTDAKISEMAARARANVVGMRRFEKDIFINVRNKKVVEAYLGKWKNEYEHGIGKFNEIDKIFAVKGEKTDKETFAKIKQLLKTYHDGFTDVYKNISEGNILTSLDAVAAIDHYRDDVRTLEKLVKEFSYKYAERMYSIESNLVATSANTSYFIFAIIAVVVLVMVGISIFMTKSITGPVTKGLAFAERVAKGDFTERIDLDQKDELGMLGKALNEAADNLEKLVSEVLVSAQNLTQAVQEISSGNENLSQRTSEQASSLEEVASTIEEATASIRQNAENAIEAKKLTDAGAEKSAEGGKVAQQAVDAINEINQSSKKIGEIIGVINEIAFQTNLLALNAAVEAARAGEQGRGFAVVAGEVRNLAQRAAAASKEISDLIRDSLEKVAKGTEMVNKSGATLSEIVEAAKSTAQLISEIAAASEEQKRGVDQINIAISELDTMTQQNAALVEETASASEEMAGQAQELMSMMERFKIRDAVRKDTFEKKHKEMHLHGTKAEATKPAAKAVKMAKDAPKEKGKDLRGIMAEDGFEEF